jgi:SAM-dependent methyltransferase
MRFLNIGCGDRHHPEWINLDFVATGPAVQQYDLRRGIPFPESTFDIVYHSHVLEHFERKAALNLLRECHRVLRPGGTIRVVVPDLERIVQLYLWALENVASSGGAGRAIYDWTLLELYDQAVRQRPGGEMLDFAREAPTDQLEFLRQRLGGELDRMLRPRVSTQDQNFLRTKKNIKRFAEGLRRILLRLVAGREGMRFYDLGRFRLAGEVHLWMYDRYSLGRVLEEAGFTCPQCVGATESAILEWADFRLDTEADGQIYKPDSLYMEASR